MTNQEFNILFRDRTRKFAVHIFHFLNGLPRTNSSRIIGYQLGKAGSSVGANFRAFCRGRSKREKFAKICIVVEEADEVEYWLLILLDLKLGDQLKLKDLLSEALEIIKITSKIKSKLRGSS